MSNGKLHFCPDCPNRGTHIGSVCDSQVDIRAKEGCDEVTLRLLDLTGGQSNPFYVSRSKLDANCLRTKLTQGLIEEAVLGCYTRVRDCVGPTTTTDVNGIRVNSGVCPALTEAAILHSLRTVQGDK